MDNIRVAEYLLRIGVAFAFAYPAVAALGDPLSWIAYMPAFVRELPLAETFTLHLFGGVEIVVALWVLFGARIYIPALFGTIILLAIIAFNAAQFDVLFRDVSIALAAAALAALSFSRSRDRGSRVMR